MANTVWESHRKRFESLESSSPGSLQAHFYHESGWVLEGGPDHPRRRATLLQRFEAFAIQAEAAASGAAPSTSCDAWLNRLREQVPQYFTELSPSMLVVTEPEEIPYSEIQAPKPNEISALPTSSKSKLVVARRGDKYEIIRNHRLYAELKPSDGGLVRCRVQFAVERKSGKLDQLREASIVLCELLEAAGPIAREPMTAASNPRAAKSQSAMVFQNRAAWLKEEMSKRDHMTPNRLRAVGGPDKKTIARVLSGQAVHSRVLHKLVAGLSHDGARISISDIPND